MHNILNCDLSNFRSNRSSVAIIVFVMFEKKISVEYSKKNVLYLTEKAPNIKIVCN